jgi:hypothetical protein
MDWNVAQVVEHLSNKCETLSSNPNTAKENYWAGGVVQVVAPASLAQSTKFKI